MDILSIVIIALLGFFTLIGIIAGSVKGFTRSRSWAVELVLAGVVAIAVSGLTAELSDMAPAVIALGASVALVCVFMLLSAVVRKFLTSRIEKRKKRWYYEHYDEIEDNTEQILSALGTEDKKSYRKLSKKKFRRSGGAWSVADRILGSLTLAVKGAVIGGFISVAFLVVLDFTRLAQPDGSLYGFAGSVYESGLWQFFKNYIFDFLVIGLIMLCIKSGFANGITSPLWSLFVFAMVVGSAILSYHLAFNAPEFIASAERLETVLAGKIESFAATLEGFGITSLVLAKVIIGTLVFILMIIAVILFAVFVPKLIDKARDSTLFRGVDGIFGAVLLTVIILGLLLVVGAVVNNLHDVPFMNAFNAYFGKSAIATYIYDKNLLNTVGLLNDLPIKDWFA